MTMTLGFDVVEYFEAFVADVKPVLLAIGKHAPGKPVRAGHYDNDTYRIVEIVNGDVKPCADEKEIAAAIADVGGFAVWPSADAPEGLPPLILPGAGWNVAALLAEPAMAKLIERERFIRQTTGSDRAKRLVDERGWEILDVAEQYRLVTVFR